PRNDGQQVKAQGEGRDETPGLASGGSTGQLGEELRQLNRLRRAVRQKVIKALKSAAKVEVVGARSSGDSGLTLRLELDGSPVTLELSGVEIVEGDLNTAESNSKGRRARLNRVKRPEELSIQELKDRGLPLYWNEKW